ncbi:MAG: cysteine desulfurase family protein [Moorellales bacterium]
MASSRLVYLDNSATTPVRPEVRAAVYRALETVWGNPSSRHRLGLEAEKAVERARTSLARVLAVSPEEIVFTSGGTEANNLALKGLARALRRRGRHLITSAVEHPSVLNVCRQLEAEEGFEVTYLPVDESGLVRPEDVVGALRPDTVLVSIMHVNNEVGAIQPVEEIGRLLARQPEKVYFHVDAVQSFGRLQLRPKAWNIDLLTLSAHKICGPKGVGALYVRRGIRLAPLMAGGDQEGGRRPGTENVPGIVGFGVAAELCAAEAAQAVPRLQELRRRLCEGIRERLPWVRYNGPPEEAAAPHILNVSFYVPAEWLLHFLEREGIYVSSGAACHSRRPEPSHVLAAMGLAREELGSAIRFSLSSLTTEEDIDYTIAKLGELVPELRRLAETGRQP